MKRNFRKNLVLIFNFSPRGLPLVAFLIFNCFFLGCGIDSQFKSAEKLIEKGKFSEAIQKYEKIIEKNPESPRVPESVYGIARIYHKNICLLS